MTSPRFVLPLLASTVLATATRLDAGVWWADVPAQDAPPQDRGLPYTRSADAAARKKIAGGIAVFVGSRYAYVNGVKVRLSDRDLLRAEALRENGEVWVPGAFARILGEKVASPTLDADLAPLGDRWVFAPAELLPALAEKADGAGIRHLEWKGPSTVKTRKIEWDLWVDFRAAARARGLVVTDLGGGLFWAGPSGLSFEPGEEALRDCVVALFDTPEKYADPRIPARALPPLARQGEWTNHVKVSAEQLAVIEGPETKWTLLPKSSYDETGFDRKRLGSAVPAPGVYPRLLFSRADLPALRKGMESDPLGRKSLIENRVLFEKGVWDPKTDDGKWFAKLASGDVAGLEFDNPKGGIQPEHRFKGYKPSVYSSHVAYVPELLTQMALYCLVTGDEVHGAQAGKALANYYRLREKTLDLWLSLSDSEWSSSATLEDGRKVKLEAENSRTHWRSIHGLMAHMNLPFALDFGGAFMSDEDRDAMRRIIAKTTYGRRSYGQDAPLRFRDINWMGWDLTHFLAVASIEGLRGFDPEGFAAGAESIRAFLDFGIDENGVVYESNGKTTGSFQFILLSMITLARRGDGLFGHPHWRKLPMSQILMTSPSGRVTVNSGTQYHPYSRNPFALFLLDQLHGFYPSQRETHYLLSKAIRMPAAGNGESGVSNWPVDAYDETTYPAKIASLPRLRLPSLTYPGVAGAFLYSTMFRPTTREEVKPPLDSVSPVHGVFSSYGDASTNATWIHMMVRPNHYLGAGHHHADAGMFHFSALGVDWFTQTAFDQAYDGKYFNLAQVDGESQADSTNGILGWNAAAKWTGSVLGAKASAARADLTYAYSWRWLTQPPRVWTPELRAMGWELEPSPENLKNWAGTARAKFRPWWPNSTFGNFIATSRAPFNPMRHVHRVTALVRGATSWAMVVDDLKKDDAKRLYTWAAMLNGGVAKSDVAGLRVNELVLATSGVDPVLTNSEAPSPLRPKDGDPLLLVVALGMDESGTEDKVLVGTEHLLGAKGRRGEVQYFDRLAVHRLATEARFRVLLLPYRHGEKRPEWKWDAKEGKATVTYGSQIDEVRFRIGEGDATRIEVRRKGEVLLNF